MAAAITTGGSTLEQQALEVLQELADQQRDTDTANPNGLNVVTTNTYNDATGIYNVSISLPVTSSRDGTTGAITLSATEVFGV